MLRVHGLLKLAKTWALVCAQDACDRGLDPDEFVEDMKKRGIRVAGIGHRIKSKVGALSRPG
jgi:citrate synthase